MSIQLNDQGLNLEEMKHFKGVNYSVAASILKSNELSNAVNTWAPAIGYIGKRPGSIAHQSLPSGTVRGFKRFYRSNGDKFSVVAIENSSLITIFYSVTDAAVVSTLSGGTTYGAGDVSFAVYQDNLYVSNGNDPIKKWTGSGAMTDVAGGWSAGRRGDFLQIYNDRLISVLKEGTFYFSDAFNAEVVTAGTQQEFIGDRANDLVTGVGLLGIQTDTDGLAGGIVFFKRNSIWMLKGAVTAQGVIDQISGRTGCVGHKTIAHTPYGIMFLGAESVYLLQASGEPIDIGEPIRTKLNEIPAAQKVNAVGIYHNRHYKLSFAPAGAARNKHQYWLDLRRPIEDLSWWGPMHGGSDRYSFAEIEVLHSDDRPVSTLSTDVAEQAVAVSDDAKPVLLYIDQNTFDDRGSATSMAAGTYEHGAENLWAKKEYRKAGVNIRNDANESITLEVTVDDGADLYSTNLTLSGSGAQWDASNWDDALWGGTFFQFIADSLDKPKRGSKAKVTIRHNTASDIRIEAMQLLYFLSERIMEE